MYDALGRLTAYSDGENTETYLYDALGNRTAKYLNGSPVAAYQYTAFSQLTAVTQGEDVYSYHYDRRGNLTEERHGDQVLKNYVYDAANRMISGTNLVTGRKSEYTYNGLLARVKKASDAIVSTYIPDYIGGMHNDLVTQVSGLGTVNAAFAHGYSRASQRFTPEAGVSIPAADTYFQPDLYGSPLFAADADGMIKHRADHDLWGMPKNTCEDSAISAGLRFTTYEYDPVLEKHFAHARLYDPAQGRMLGTDPVKRGLNGYAYCGNDPVNHTDPTGEIANILLGGFAGGIIGGAFGFAGSALSQLAEGKGFNARKAWGAAANGAIVGAARGALTGSGVGIPAALGVNFAAGMAGSLAEQRLAGERMSPVRAAVDGAFNALGGRIYGTSPLRNAKDAIMNSVYVGEQGSIIYEGDIIHTYLFKKAFTGFELWIGFDVIPEFPYEIYEPDLFICPECGEEVIGRTEPYDDIKGWFLDGLFCRHCNKWTLEPIAKRDTTIYTLVFSYKNLKIMADSSVKRGIMNCLEKVPDKKIQGDKMIIHTNSEKIIEIVPCLQSADFTYDIEPSFPHKID